MPSEWRDILETKLASLFSSDADRAAACAALVPVVSGREGERVAVACLKLAGSDLAELRTCVAVALADYRDVLAWAESPRQMRAGPGAPQSDRARASREDAQEYAEWLRGPLK